MKIIAKKEDKDYYDSVQGLGQDPAVVYHRAPEVIPVGHLNLGYAGYYAPKPTSLVPVALHEIGTKLGVYGSNRAQVKLSGVARPVELEKTKTLVGFCGELYLATRIVVAYDQVNHPGERFRTYYDVDKLAAAFPELKEPATEDLRAFGTLDATPPRYYAMRPQGMRIPRVGYRRLGLLNAQNQDELFRDVVGAPVFTLNGGEYTKNPVLKPLEFFRAVDPTQAFQRLEQYLSNQFLSQYPLPRELTEKQQVTRHGFDETYGFRTRPKKK